MPRRPLLVLCVVFAVSGCGAHAKSGGNGRTAGSGHQASNEEIAKQIRANDARRDQMGSSDTSDLTLEDRLKSTILFAEGKQGLNAGMPAPEPMSATIAAIRAAGVKLQLTGVQGQTMSGYAHFLLLKDNSAELMSSARDAKTRSKLSQLGPRLARLRQQVDAIQNLAGEVNFNVETTGTLMPLLKTASMVTVRKHYGMDFDDADYARVKKLLEREHRKEAVAAASLGLLAATQGVINGNTDPKAIDKLGDDLLQALPMKVEVSDQEAKTYVDNFQSSVSSVKSRYEGIMKKTLGEERYERTMRPQVNALFMQIDQAEKTQLRQDPSASGDQDASSDEASAAADRAAGRLEKKGEGQVESALGSIPGLSAIEASAEGVQALINGDPKAALNAALKLVPGGGLIKQGIGAIVSLFG